MPLADLKVVEIMRGGNLQSPRTKLWIDEVVADHGKKSIDDGKADLGPDQGAVSIVLRMYRDCEITKHGLRASRCHDKTVGGIGG